MTRLAPEDAARLLQEARGERRTLTPFTDEDARLDEHWAYDVQDVDRRQRTEAGERVIGAKLGLTSVAKQTRMGVDRPIVGFLTDAMTCTASEVRDRLAAWAQPRIEPEIAFLTNRPIDAELSREEAAAAVGGVLVAAEILDSRWTGYRFRLPDVVADNTSAAGVVRGAEVRSLAEVGDLASLACRVTVDGEVVHEATGAAILGDPLEALRLLSRHLEQRGEVLPAGSLVLAGALTDAVPLAGRVELDIERLGRVTVDVGRR